MDQQGASGDALRRLAIQAGIYLGVFLGGALVAFLYSYMPLHNAKNWKIDYLEERLASKDAELTARTAELETLASESGNGPDPETFKLLQKELAAADQSIQKLEGQLAKAERRAGELEKSRDDWKARHAKAESQRKAVTASAPSPAVPAAPAPPGSPVATGVRVEVGARWRTADKSGDFDLIAIEEDRARVVANGSKLRPGAIPKTQDVAAGEFFVIEGPAGAPLEVHVRRIDGESSIVVDVLD